jgi:hypothetical protein
MGARGATTAREEDPVADDDGRRPSPPGNECLSTCFPSGPIPASPPPGTGRDARSWQDTAA